MKRAVSPGLPVPRSLGVAGSRSPESLGPRSRRGRLTERLAGFTMPEILVSLFILSSSMFILSELQVKSMMRVWYGREEIDRLYTVKKYLYKSYLDPEKARKQTRQFEDPELKITVQPAGIHKKSSLAPYSDYLQLLNSSGSWTRGDRPRTLSIVTCVPRPEKKEGE